MWASRFSSLSQTYRTLHWGSALKFRMRLGPQYPHPTTAMVIFFGMSGLLSVEIPAYGLFFFGFLVVAPVIPLVIPFRLRFHPFSTTPSSFFSPTSSMACLYRRCGVNPRRQMTMNPSTRSRRAWVSDTGMTGGVSRRTRSYCSRLP